LRNGTNESEILKTKYAHRFVVRFRNETAAITLQINANTLPCCTTG